MNRPLVTILGGAGFIGTALCELLLAGNYHVRVMDNFIRNNGNCIIPFVDRKNFEFIKGDVTNYKDVQKAVKGANAVVHLSALVGAPICDRNIALTHLINVDGTKLVMNAVSQDQQVVYASTGSVYGAIESGLCTEDTPTNPLSVYAVTKLQAEEIVLQHPKSVAYRFATAFGVAPNIRMDLLINDLTWRAVVEKSMILFQSNFRRTFCHVRDIASALKFAIDNPEKMTGVFNVGDEHGNWTKKEVAEYLKSKTGCYVAYADSGYEDADARNYSVNYDKIHSKGWMAGISMEEGIDELIKVIPMLASSTFKDKL